MTSPDHTTRWPAKRLLFAAVALLILVSGGGIGAGARRRDRRDRHHFAGIGRNHRGLAEIIEFLARRGANALGSEVGFGHV